MGRTKMKDFFLISFLVAQFLFFFFHLSICMKCYWFVPWLSLRSHRLIRREDFRNNER